MKKKKTSYFDRFMAMSDQQRKLEVAEFDKEDLRPGTSLTVAERKRFERTVKRGRPRVGMGAEKIRVSLERGLLAQTNKLAERRHMSRSQVIAEGLRLLLKSA